MKTAIALIVLLSGLQATGQVAPTRQPRAETYQSANVDADGNLQIVTFAGQKVTVGKGGSDRVVEAFGTQKTFTEPVLSNDRQVVVAKAMFGNCCTSYDIPLQLVIYSAGKVHRFEPGLVVTDWHFVDGSRRIAFGRTTVHAGCATFWELRDIATEQLVAEADIPEPCGMFPDPEKVTVPQWVTGPVSGIK